MLNLRLARFEALVDVGRVARRCDGSSDRRRRLLVGAMVRQCDIEERRRRRRGRSAARAGDAADRPLPDPQPGHGRRLDRPRRPRRRVSRRSRSRSTPSSRWRAQRARAASPPADFFTGTWTTALAPTRSARPRCGSRSGAPGRGFAVEEVARRHGDFAIAGAVRRRAGRRRARRRGRHRAVRHGQHTGARRRRRSGARRRRRRRRRCRRDRRRPPSTASTRPTTCTRRARCGAGSAPPSSPRAVAPSAARRPADG